MIAGDFCYFPPGWLHRVRTYDKSIGVGGYLLLEACVRESEVLCSHLEQVIGPAGEYEEFFWYALPSPDAKP